MSETLGTFIDPHFFTLPASSTTTAATKSIAEEANHDPLPPSDDEDEDSGAEEEDEEVPELETLKNKLLTQVAGKLKEDQPEKFQHLDQNQVKEKLLQDIVQKVERSDQNYIESEACFQEYARLYSRYQREESDSGKSNGPSVGGQSGYGTRRKRTSRSRSRSRSIKEKPTKVVDMKSQDCSTIPHDACILFQSKRRGGKSYAIVSILLALCLDRIVLFGKGRDSAFWTQYVKQMYIYEDFVEEKFAAILRDQEHLLNLTKKPGCEHLNIDLAIVLEDFSYDDQVMRSKAISDLVSNGRRLHVLFLCSAQYLKSIKPKVRTQFDYFFLFQEKNQDVRKILYDACGSYFDSKEEFFKLLDATANNRRCLVINNSADKTEKTEDFTRYFKAKTPLEKRELGSFLYRMFAELYFIKPEEEEGTEESSEKSLMSDLAKPKVINKIPENENMPVNLIEEQVNKKGTFEVICLSGKNEQHIISFSDD
jgi:hypothetical protein